jgi:uncharacterized protein YbjT (DUF2867 family)
MATNADWILYGANGFTGRLIAREAKRKSLRPILAGRRAAPIEALGAQLDLPRRSFDIGDPSAAAAALSDVDVVLNCAGPFAATSRQMLDASAWPAGRITSTSPARSTSSSPRTRDTRRRKPPASSCAPASASTSFRPIAWPPF